MSTLLTNALLFGLALSLVLLAIMAISLFLAPDMWVNDYPPDIRQKYGPRSPKAARLRPFIAIPFFLAVLGFPLLALVRLETLFAAQVGFLPAFLSSFLVLLTFNAFDLLVLDWLLFVTIQPSWIILPGTEGMAGYRDYHFHFIGFLKGLIFTAVAAAVSAVLWLLVQRVMM